jgi:hypothetical protein
LLLEDSALVPVEFVPFTLKVYVVLADKPETEIGEVAEDPVTEPGVDVAVKVEAVPPVGDIVNGTDAIVPLFVTVPTLGLSGISAIFEVCAEASL